MTKILGLDLGSNSIGWALLEEVDGKPSRIIDLGSRIFTKAVEEKTPTPKNVKRRNARLARRVIQRRARRKQRMLNYLVSLELLPEALKGHAQPEKILNTLGNPYDLRAKALDEPLEPFELGRVFLHLVQRRGFLSNRKTLLSDMIDDPDVLSVLNELDEESNQGDTTEKAKEETAFKKDISQLRQKIDSVSCRTLGEYLATLKHGDYKRNRNRSGGHLRTDRQMYRDELEMIWEEQKKHHDTLTDEVKEQVDNIIFYQRPLKLKEDRVGKCSLEPKSKRARVARLEYQRFRYLQDINNLQYFDRFDDAWVALSGEQKEKLKVLFENKPSITFPAMRRELKLDKSAEFNLEDANKKLKGNITACEIRVVLPQWDGMSADDQLALLEDLLSFQKKSALKKRLMGHWGFDVKTAVNLCLLEFEPGHGSLSLKAIRKMLPYLEQGEIYSDARVSAGYGYEQEQGGTVDKLGLPPEIPNPIVSKGLYELRRVINALIAEYGKPDKIRIEMARDLEMNTKRYKDFTARQRKNTKVNEEASEKYQQAGKEYPHLHLSKYPSHADKLKYRLWKDQQEMCAYDISGRKISLAELFSADIEIDHILPYSQSLDDSYMNKVICRTKENRRKGQRTPVDAFSGEQWEQIVQRISRWDRSVKSKKNRFFMKAADVQQRDFISTQLNDTRYISKVALDYLKTLGADINVTKGIMTGWLRHQWGLNSLIGQDKKNKDRVDHRHHTIDAVVTACIDRSFYTALVRMAKDLEKEKQGFTPKDIHIDPPWQNLRNDLHTALENMIVSHTPHRKITGGLHEETGVGFIEGVGTVYRANLSPDFKLPQVKKIVDSEVRELIGKHLLAYGNDPKKAFAEGVVVYHKDGKTPIKRVRIVQSKTTRKKLESTKFGVKNKQGKVFRWMAYGNMHHVEIIQHKETKAYKGVFVTALEAYRRAMTGSKSAIKRGVLFEPIIKTEHSEQYDFVMALHINDLVSVDKEESSICYRVQKLDSSNKRVHLRLHTASTIANDSETFPDRELTIPALMVKNMKLHTVNAIGKLLND